MRHAWGWVWVAVFCLLAHPVLAQDSRAPEIASMERLCAQLATVVPQGQGKVGLSLTDLTTGCTIGIRDTDPVNPASVIKVPVMVEAYIQASHGRFRFSDKLVLKASHKVWGAGPLYAQRVGQGFTVQYLVECMIHFSDNTATKMLVDYLGKENINRSMKRLGLQHTVIGNGDLLKAEGQNFSTPRDMNVLLVKIAKGQVVSPKACREMLSILALQKYRWGIPKPVSQDVLVANKTGTLNGKKHDCGIVFLRGSPYVLSVFTTDFKSVFTAMHIVSQVSEITYTWALARAL